MRETVQKDRVRLSFISAGSRQPLDRHIFGELKAEAQERLDEICMDEDLADLNVRAILSVDAGYKIPTEHMRKSWDNLFVADDLEEEDCLRRMA